MDGEPQAFHPRWARNLLIGSLALNVFLAGFMFARTLGPKHTDRAAEPAVFSLRALPSDMPLEVREEFEKNFKAVRPEIVKDYRELVNARLKVKALLDDESFNPDELSAALAEVRGLQTRIQGPLHHALVESMKDLDADARRQFAFQIDSLEGGGVWAPRHFDGARWRVDFDNGKIILDFKTFDHGEDGEENGGEEGE
ncbi:MAG TPA: periplasmic heavy metal sensor [Sphingomonadales bacterium]|nr:periplasmic heavy metal sensor [Sphingomonadales bacterium]